MKTKLLIVACVALIGAVLAGCTSPGASSATAAQQANRAYMSQVNETMVELDENLAPFVAAVSRGDVVNMRTQADNAYKTLDKLAGIEAPEDLKEVHDCYVNGTGKLRQALDGYIDLYTEMSKSSLDSTTYNKRIAEIQALYDEGVALLQKGDEIAAGSTQSASTSASASASASESASASSSIQAADSSSSASAQSSDSSSSSSASSASSASA